jgi:hypothetical protein
LVIKIVPPPLTVPKELSLPYALVSIATKKITELIAWCDKTNKLPHTILPKKVKPDNPAAIKPKTCHSQTFPSATIPFSPIFALSRF